VTLGLFDDLPLVPAQTLTAGVDEAGRGPLAGPVAAAAVILDPARPVSGLADSKALSESRRDELAGAIRESALAWCVSFAQVAEIDRLNILHASMAAMARAVVALVPAPQVVLVDGNRCPPVACTAHAVVQGDRRVACISAASILAKVARDSRMRELDALYPGYGFARHKGYPTAMHRAALSRLGPTPEHRRSFGPVRACLAGSEAAGIVR
jgi:ribonuclease HII